MAKSLAAEITAANIQENLLKLCKKTFLLGSVMHCTSINQSNIRLLTGRITRLTQTQAGFTEELGVGKMNN